LILEGESLTDDSRTGMSMENKKGELHSMPPAIYKSEFKLDG
jgi:hypothetical protein